VYGLGLGDSVVGRDSTATFAEVASLPLVTRGHDTSVEGVLSLNPTLVLASKDNSGPSTALDQLRNVGVPVLVLKDPDSVEDIAPRIRLLAQALGVPDAGESLVTSTEQRLAEARAGIPSNAGATKVAFLYMRGQVGVYLIAGPKSGADSIIRAAGAVDAGTAMGLGQPFTPLTSEALASAAPDVILMTTTGLESVGGIEGLVKIPGIAQTPAGKAKRIVAMEDSLLYSFGPRTPLAVEELIGALYGGLAQSPK
jgi:iron complex transport system substrate-binding protein